MKYLKDIGLFTILIISILNTVVFWWIFGVADVRFWFTIIILILSGVVFINSVIYFAYLAIKKSNKIRLVSIITLIIIGLLSAFFINHGWKKTHAFNSCIQQYSINSTKLGDCMDRYSVVDWLSYLWVSP